MGSNDMGVDGMRFDGKVAIVTGSGQGIGEAYAKRLARDGARVVVSELNPEQGERVAKEIEQAGGEAIFVSTDVSNEASTRAMAEEVGRRFGRIDYLVNNAAIFHDMERHTLLDVPIEYWNKFFSVNMTGALLVTRAVHPAMVEAGGGAIVNQSSTAAWMNVSGYYGIAKLAINGLTTAMARELAPSRIRVNAIAPGFTNTEATRQLGAVIETLVKTVPIGRLAEPEEMAAACAFLLSDEASYITGHVLSVDGGQIVRV